MKPLIITGPTGCGKTKIAEKVARKLHGEIISADSRTLYSRVRIASGRYTLSSDIKYHLVDLVDPGEIFPVYQFLISARDITKDLMGRDIQPIICGGSMLFVERFIKGMKPSPSPDMELRYRLRRLEMDLGPGYLHSMLSQIDPEEANRIYVTNVKQTIRSLEKSLLKDNEQGGIPPLSEFACFFLERNSADLRKKIGKRLDDMIKRGFLDESEEFFKAGMDTSLPGLDSIGYDHAFNYLDGKIDFEEMKKRILSDTYLLARKQMKWKKKIPCSEIVMDNFSNDDILNLIIKGLTC